MLIPPSEDASVFKQPRKSIGTEQQGEIDDRFEESDRSAEPEIGDGLESDAVDISVDDITGFIDGRIVQVEDLVETGIHDATNIEDQQNDYSGLDAWPCDVENSLKPIRSIDDGCLIQGRIDGTDGSQIDDRSPSSFLPDGSAVKQRPEKSRCAHETDFLDADKCQQVVDCAIVVQQIHDDTGNDDPREKMRKGVDRLESLLEPTVVQLVDQDRQHDGDQEGEDDTAETDGQGVLECAPEHVISKYVFEITQPDEWAAPNPLVIHEFLERELYAIHGAVIE